MDEENRGYPGQCVCGTGRLRRERRYSGEEVQEGEEEKEEEDEEEEEEREEEEEEEEEEQGSLGSRPHVVAFFNVRVSNPITCRAPFVSRKGDRNDRRNKRSRENADSRSEGEELPRLCTEDRVIVNSLRRRNACPFYARGFPCSHKNTDAERDHSSHDEDVIPYTYYLPMNTLTQGLDEDGILTTLEMISEYTVMEDRASTGTGATRA